MKKKVCILSSVIITAVLTAGCSPNTSSQAPSTTIDFTYGIAHKDAKVLLNPQRDYLIVVNDHAQYNFDGKYNQALQSDLVYFPNVIDGDITAAEKATYLAFTSLQYDLEHNDGIKIGIYDGYRTAKDQDYLIGLYDNNAPTITLPSKAGYSEHHTGLLLDAVLWYSPDGQAYEWYSASSDRIASIPEFQTFYRKMVDYGFIMRYPPDKVDITGMKDKEFEIRFVGSAAVAHDIVDNGLCLEEYVVQHH